MTLIDPERSMMHKEEVAYGASVTEALLKKLGGELNFLNTRHHETKRFTINGIYSSSVIATPYNAIDGIHVFEFAAEIFNAWIYNRAKGSSGTTSLDLKWKANDSTVWTSVFSTVPSFTTTASDNEMCGIGDVKTGFTAAILGKSTFNAKDAIRMDLVSAMGGSPSGCGLILQYRPR
ncbi:MAG: hypothetical protein AAGB31_15490 [Bdellovibrio sp.]